MDKGKVETKKPSNDIDDYVVDDQSGFGAPSVGGMDVVLLSMIRDLSSVFEVSGPSGYSKVLRTKILLRRLGMFRPINNYYSRHCGLDYHRKGLLL